jgi:hypothetical protein
VIAPEAPAASDFAKYGIESFHAPRSYLETGEAGQSSVEGDAPYAWSIPPEAQDLVAPAAAWLCHEVIGKKASLAGDPLIQQRTRQIALVYKDQNSTLAPLLMQAVQEECGYKFDGPYQVGGTGATSATAVGEMASHGDTSVLCLPCDNQGGIETASDQQRYFPEHLFIGDFAGNNWEGRMQEPQQFKDAFGLSWMWWQPAPTATYWYQAYKQTDAATNPDISFGIEIYEHLLALFSAIQLAGPNLTPDSISQGMLRWQRTSPAPYSPGGSFRPGHHAFINDYALVYWDPSGTPPGGPEPSVATTEQGGCYRWVDGGARRGSDFAWPSVDELAAAVADPSRAPCGGDLGTNGGDNDQDATAHG